MTKILRNVKITIEVVEEITIASETMDQATDSNREEAEPEEEANLNTNEASPRQPQTPPNEPDFQNETPPNSVTDSYTESEDDDVFENSFESAVSYMDVDSPKNLDK